jgi:hypothetical protein
MSAQLSKMHVRFIQSQKNFYLFTHDDTQGQKLPISQLYVKDNSNFYLVNQDGPIHDEQTLRIVFKESTDALNTLECTVTLQALEQENEAYEDALLFFHVDVEKVTQLLLLNIQTVKDN